MPQILILGSPYMDRVRVGCWGYWGGGNWISAVLQRRERCSDRLFQLRLEQVKQKKHTKNTHKHSSRQRREKKSLALSTRHSWSLARPRRRHRTSEVTSVGGSSHFKSAFRFFFSFSDICRQSVTPASFCSLLTLTEQIWRRHRRLLAAASSTLPPLQLHQPAAMDNHPTG